MRAHEFIPDIDKWNWRVTVKEAAAEGSPADLMTDEFYDTMRETGLAAKVEVALTETNNRTVDLVSILVRKNKGQGFGSKVMNLLTTLADKHGVVLTLTPAEDADDIDQLIEWYMRYGFRGGVRGMKRRPEITHEFMTENMRNKVDKHKEHVRNIEGCVD